jgi:transcriptional regulator with XRE-family HTH domain
MHVTYIGTIERGGNVPSLATILELADVLGADVGELMREVADARNPRRPAAS